MKITFILQQGLLQPRPKNFMKQKLLLAILLFVSLTPVKAITYYVDAARPDNSGAGTTWATAEKELQVAINEAVSGDQVWVKAGTYKPTTGADRNISFTLKNGVAVYGGFVGTETLLNQRSFVYNATILSGDLLGNDVGFTNNGENSYHVIICTSLNSTAVLDGFTITKGNANGGSSQSGGGMLCTSAPTLNNLLFTLNNAQGGGGAISLQPAGAVTVTNCVFDNNLTDGFGGAIEIVGASTNTAHSFINCIFYNNTAGFGGAFTIITWNANFTNCNFSKNHATNPVGAPNAYLAYIELSDVKMKNVVIWVTDISPSGYYMEILNSNFSASNSLIQAGWGGINFVNTLANPLVADVNDGDGPDNIWRNADDGLRISCSSPAINASDPATVLTKDIMGITRVGIADIGAYESGSQNISPSAIASANSEVLLTQNATGITNYSTCSNLVATINSSGAYTIAGGVKATVWLEAAQPAQYLKRHYEITPATNAATATAKVTLYFTQQEFTDFNAVNAIKLPVDATDAANNKANLRIEKRSGTSSDGSGLPNTYPVGTPETITPSPVFWNSTASRWEVTFDVLTGFSGFFVKTITTVLPLRLLSFTGSKANTLNKLQWNTTSETNTKQFNVEWMVAGAQWTVLSPVTAYGSGDHSYTINHTNPPAGIVFYRLKMIDVDGNFTYSNIISLSSGGINGINIYPNPASGFINITVGNHLLNTKVQLYNSAGQLIQTKQMTTLNQQLVIKGYANGIYQLRFVDGSVATFIKEKE